jgi:hypothetical protein
VNHIKHSGRLLHISSYWNTYVKRSDAKVAVYFLASVRVDQRNCRNYQPNSNRPHLVRSTIKMSHRNRNRPVCVGYKYLVNFTKFFFKKGVFPLAIGLARLCGSQILIRKKGVPESM